MTTHPRRELEWRLAVPRRSQAIGRPPMVVPPELLGAPPGVVRDLPSALEKELPSPRSRPGWRRSRVPQGGAHRQGGARSRSWPARMDLVAASRDPRRRLQSAADDQPRAGGCDALDGTRILVTAGLDSPREVRELPRRPARDRGPRPAHSAALGLRSNWEDGPCETKSSAGRPPRFPVDAGHCLGDR